jgi:phytoene desaturase
LGIEGTLPDLAHHTIYLTKDYERNIKEIEDGLELPAEPSFYVQNACVTDPMLAPSGHSTLYVLVPVAHRTGVIDWRREQASFRALVLKRLERIGLTGIEKRIRFEKVLTPQGWEDDMQIYRGATFNLAHSLDQMLHLRPRNRFEDLEGVYLVGGGTHPGSGLPVIFESARITSRLMADQLGLSQNWEAGTLMAAGQPALVEERVS